MAEPGAKVPHAGPERIEVGQGAGSTKLGPYLEGSVHPAFLPVARTLRTLLAEYGGGAAACVYHRGQPVVDLWGGLRNAQGATWNRDTICPSFSTTKGVASTLMHMMVDRGQLDYDDRVAEHWPEFAQAGKSEITVRQVMAHRSGLYHIRQMIDRADRMLDWQHMIHAIEEAEPIHPPGARTGYHGLTYGFLVGEILQRVTGRAFPELVKEHLVEPLGLDGMYVGAPESALERSAELLWPVDRDLPRRALPDWLRPRLAETLTWLAKRGPAIDLPGVQLDIGSIFDALAPRGIASFDFNASETLRAAIPAANGLFTARSLARMYAALSSGGSIDGVRLLSPATLARATEPQGEGRARSVVPIDMRWRLGYHGVATTRGIPRRAFGHFGFGGSGAWADPSRELSVALVVNRGIGTPFGDLRIVRLGGAVLESLGESDAWNPFAMAKGLRSFLDPSRAASARG